MQDLPHVKLDSPVARGLFSLFSRPSRYVFGVDGLSGFADHPVESRAHPWILDAAHAVVWVGAPDDGLAGLIFPPIKLQRFSGHAQGVIPFRHALFRFFSPGKLQPNRLPIASHDAGGVRSADTGAALGLLLW